MENVNVAPKGNTCLECSWRGGESSGRRREDRHANECVLRPRGCYSFDKATRPASQGNPLEEVFLELAFERQKRSAPLNSCLFWQKGVYSVKRQNQVCLQMDSLTGQGVCLGALKMPNCLPTSFKTIMIIYT